MSTLSVSSYVIACDADGCDQTSEPGVSVDFAEEAAVESGWHLSITRPASDRCPRHMEQDS